MTPANPISCPSCNNAVDADARFCKYCAFELSKSPTDSAATIPAAPSSPSANSKRMVFFGIAVVGLLVLVIIGGYIYMRPRAQARAPNNSEPDNSATSSAAAVSDRAKQIEEKILRGEVLNESDIVGLSPYELRVLRNVHLARYGRKYDQNSELGSYFYTRPWYKPSDSYSDNLVNATDKANINLILAAERAAQTPSTSTNSSSPVQSAQGTPSPSPPPAQPTQTNSKYELSREQMRQIILRRGFYDAFWGWRHLDRVEILKVGEFKEREKYWPVQAKGLYGNKYYILDYQIFLNDYGEWEVRMANPTLTYLS